MKLVLAEKPSVAKSLAKVLLAKILSNPVLHLHREYCKLGFHLKNGTPHSRYFSDELGVPNFLSRYLSRYRTSVCQMWRHMV